ncbi:GSCFA domain-containing protein [Rhizobium sp. KVB221]|uniref:GSCFA domain-containing protein n=1 Tax=Rhizobium setariae TaxID=2801340 RepID=A0A936YPW0_9HYPH|nr:GSCFA domain-containing protein [Rhizobium setariae]MBL0372281.1 GSCFA domain-containing protein [Rhizobium setariae]
MSDFIKYEQDGQVKKTTYTFFRGDTANFHPTDESLTRSGFLRDYVVNGLLPDVPPISKETPIVPFGSCFASNIQQYLVDRGYNVLTKTGRKNYISWMGDGMVNTFAILQQFEWAWEGKVPQVDLWHGYKAEVFGYDEAVRQSTVDMLNECDVFIITLGLSEVWFDEPTQSVFWRAVPKENFDPARHKFRVSSVAENSSNLERIRLLIRKYRPDARLIFTLSPVPLTATFRDMSCISANAVSKSVLRAAIDEFMQGPAGTDTYTHYFPSYEVVTGLFMSPFMEDRKHPHAHVIDINMRIFEKYFCNSSISDDDLDASFAQAQLLDYQVACDGHFAVPRTFSPRGGGAVARPGQDDDTKRTHRSSKS